MKHVALTPFGGQPVTSALLSAREALRQAPVPSCPIDKWSVFNDLRDARKAYDISDRDLTVLHALLSFLPAKDLAPGAALTVFPSNRALAERAHGMAESTLRRHLAQLVTAGLVWRQDSPNGKRFARRDASGEFAQVYGFDLSPLLQRAEDFAAAAAEIRSLEEARHLTRERLVLKLRDATKLLAHARLASLAPEAAASLEAELFALRAQLRRKLDLAQLSELEAQACGYLERLYPDSTDLSGNDAQNERHHSNSDKDLKDSEMSPLTLFPSQCAAEPEEAEKKEAPKPQLPLGLVLAACPELTPYLSETPQSWRDFSAMAGSLHRMMGISTDLWREAKSAMGPENAAITLAAMLQRFSEIKNHGGYLRRLSRRAAEGLFTPVRMVMSLLNRAEPLAASQS